MTRPLEVLRQYSFMERIYLVVVWAFEKVIGRQVTELIELKVLLRDLRDDRFRVRREGRTNVLTFTDDPSLGGFSISLRRVSSDVAVFRQIFLENEYKPLIEAIPDISSVKVIVDAGANIGCSTIYFKKIFREAAVIALEPEADNYQCFVRNMQLNDLRHVTPLNAALWINNDPLELSTAFRDGREWSRAVRPSDRPTSNRVQAVTILDLLTTYSLTVIDILKIDIEGAERFIFDNEQQVGLFLPSVRFLAMEVHREFDVTDRFLAILSRFGFRHSFSGELIIAANPSESHLAATRREAR